MEFSLSLEEKAPQHTRTHERHIYPAIAGKEDDNSCISLLVYFVLSCFQVNMDRLSNSSLIRASFASCLCAFREMDKSSGQAVLKMP